MNVNTLWTLIDYYPAGGHLRVTRIFRQVVKSTLLHQFSGKMAKIIG